MQTSLYRVIYSMSFFCVGVLSGCIQDPCTSMCERVASQLQECLSDWPVSWEVFEVSSEQEFFDSCQTSWSIERSVLESRALDDAYEQCNESLDYLKSTTYICDEMRALYLIEEQY